MNLTDEPKLALTDFVDVETLQSLQDGFTRLTGIATSIRDAEGNPVTRPAGQSAFCDRVASSPTGDAACRASHEEASGLVQREQQACLHECHAGMKRFVAPIRVQGRHLGAILVGDRPVGPLARAHLESLSNLHGLPLDDLAATAGKLRPWSQRKMSSAVAFVQQLAGTIAQLCFQAYQLRSRVDELAAVYEVSSMLAGRAEIQEILDTATRQLVETMGLRASAIRLLDEDADVLRIASVANLSRKYLAKESILLAQSPLDTEALSGKMVYVADMQTDPRTYHGDIAREEGLVSLLVAPLVSAGRRIGVIRAYMGRPYEFSPFEVSLLEAIAAQVAAAIGNARLRRDVKAAERLDRQVKLAGEVQRRMIPSRPPVHPRYRFAGAYEPSSELGGDFYDFVPFDNGAVGVVIADVVGKGVPASLMMASARSALRAHARRVTDIAEIIRSVNGRLCHDTLESEFATAFYLELSGDGRRVKYCNAGHEPLLLLRRGEIIELDVGGMVLGLEPEAEYEQAEYALEPGDLLVLFTDGLTEAMNFDGEAYGRARLHASIRLHGAMAPDMPVDLVAKQLLWDVRRFAGLAPQSDDMTLVVTRVMSSE